MTHPYAHSIQEASARHPKPQGVKFSYGTAGFRTKADLLDSVMFRVGLLAALRSKNTHKTIGVMITASHNPVHDNGVKIVDPRGDMLASEWEKYASELANAADDADVVRLVHDLAARTNTDLAAKGEVFIARDTRPHSLPLSEACIEGVKALGAQVHDFGLLTTPQLHFMVRSKNVEKIDNPTDDLYYRQISDAYRTLLTGRDENVQIAPRKLIVDGADGVGGPKIAQLAPYLKGALEFTVINDGTSKDSAKLLNDGAGAEFVQKEKKIPRGIRPQEGPSIDIINKPVATVDGDADRLVYFYVDEQHKLNLVDGDKISCLAAFLIKSLLKQVGIELGRELSIGVVQTAYANGASTKYIRDTLNIEVSIVPTGVKHLHHKAEEYDIGIYFEANGHGTVLFSNKYVETIKQKQTQLQAASVAAATSATSAAAAAADVQQQSRQAAERLLALPRMINQSAGDAITDILLVEAVLALSSLTVQEWDSFYRDLPSRMSKVVVRDRSVIKTNWEETQALAPEGLQQRIDEEVRKVPDGRSFVRPSGTEDVVRVYAEARTQEEADELAFTVCNLVHELAGGIEEKPKHDRG